MSNRIIQKYMLNSSSQGGQGMLYLLEKIIEHYSPDSTLQANPKFEKVRDDESTIYLSGNRLGFATEEDVGPSILPGLVHRQDIAAGGFFTAVSELLNFDKSNSNPAAAGKYSRLDDLEALRGSDGKIHFRLVYVDNGAEVVWKQTSNPTENTNTVTGYEFISSNTATAATNFGGLSLTSGGSAPFAILQGNPGSNNWWWAVGARSIWSGAGANGLPSVNPNQSSGLIELYVL